MLNTLHRVAPSGGSHQKLAKQVAGVYRRRVGDAVVTVLLDGYIDIQPEWWINTPPQVLCNTLLADFLPADEPLRISVNAYLIEVGGRKIAIDTGSSTFFGAAAGHHAANLAAADFEPEGVDTVLLTHMHPDHIGGLIAGGRAVFPNATVFASAVEHNYWRSDVELSRAPDIARPWFDAAAELTRLYNGRLSLFAGEPEVLPGIQAVALPGHTPGHTGYLLQSGSDHLFFWADITDFLSLQLNAPERTLIFDVDKQASERARRRGLEMAATDRLLVAGSHIPFPSFGYIDGHKGSYRFVPAGWQHEL